MSAAPNPFYDVRSDLYRYAPGVVPTHETDDALWAQYAANGYTPLTQAQVLAITGPPPPFPPSMKRFADSNPCPRDNWAIDNRP
jgi:hypothetical protein